MGKIHMMVERSGDGCASFLTEHFYKSAIAEKLRSLSWQTDSKLDAKSAGVS